MRNNLISFEVESANSYRALSQLQKIAKLQKIRIDGKILKFFAHEKETEKILAICSQLCYNCQIKEKVGKSRFFEQILMKFGIFLGVVFSCLFYVIMPKFVFKIEISDLRFKEEVVEILNREDVVELIWKWKLPIEKLEDEISKIDGIAFASVVRQGTKLKINIQPELQLPEIVNQTGAPICCKKMATISRMIVYAGTPIVKVGNVVRNGAILVDGYTMFGDQKIEVVPSAEVYGFVYHSKTRIVSKKEIDNDVFSLDRLKYTALTEAYLEVFDGENVVDRWVKIVEEKESFLITATIQCETRIDI